MFAVAHNTQARSAGVVGHYHFPSGRRPRPCHLLLGQLLSSQALSCVFNHLARYQAVRQLQRSVHDLARVVMTLHQTGNRGVVVVAMKNSGARVKVGGDVARTDLSTHQIFRLEWNLLGTHSAEMCHNNPYPRDECIVSSPRPELFPDTTKKKVCMRLKPSFQKTEARFDWVELRAIRWEKNQPSPTCMHCFLQFRIRMNFGIFHDHDRPRKRLRIEVCNNALEECFVEQSSRKCTLRPISAE